MADAYASEQEALGALMEAGGRQDWDACATALEYLLRERLGGASLGSFTPVNAEEASGLLSVLVEAGANNAPGGSPVKALHDSLAAAVDGAGDMDDAFKEIMDL